MEMAPDYADGPGERSRNMGPAPSSSQSVLAFRFALIGCSCSVGELTFNGMPHRRYALRREDALPG
jgi:hypothetical protein